MKKLFKNNILAIFLLALNAACSNDPRRPEGNTVVTPTGWVQNSNLSKGVFYALATDPTNANVVYAATSTLSVYKTTDGGTTWAPASRGLPALPVRKLLVDPINPLKIYAAVAGGDLYKTSDGAASWQPVGQGLTQQTVFSVAYHPFAPPGGVGVTSGDTLNTLEWNAVPNATAYRLYSLSCSSCTSPPALGGWPSINLTDPTKLQYSHTGLTNGTPYYYVLTALVGGEETVPSSMVAAVPAAKVNGPTPPPDGIKVTVGNNQNTVAWNATSAGVTYDVYRQESPGVTTASTKISPLGGVNTTTFVDATAHNGTSYYYAVTESGAPTALSAEVAGTPSQMTALYVGTGGGGVFTSGPAGEFLGASNAGLDSTPTVPDDTPDSYDISSLVLDPSVPHAQLPTLYAGTRAGVYRSVDGGESWTANNTGLADAAVLALALGPGGILYTGTPSGVFKGTTDGSVPWRAVGAASMGSVNAIAIDPLDSNTLYAASATGGVFKSADGGGSWVQRNQGLTSTDIRSILVHPANGNLLYAGGVGVLFKSSDGGGSWMPIDLGSLDNVTNPLPNALVKAIIGPAGGSVYVGGAAGIYKSVDQGKGWTAMTTRLPIKGVQALVVDPNRPAIIYAALSEAGIYNSLDGGGSWREENGPADQPNLPSQQISKFVTSLVIDPNQPDRFYAGTQGGGVFRGIKGTEGHLSWSPVNNGLTSTGIDTLTIFPGTPSILYAGTFQSGVFKMILDGNDTWLPISGNLSDRSIFALAIHPESSSVLFAGTTQGLYQTVDGGANWSLVEGLRSADVHFVSFNPAGPSSGATLLVGSTDGVFKSTDEGAQWSHLDDGMSSPVYAILIDPQQSNIVYAGTVATGVYRRTQ